MKWNTLKLLESMINIYLRTMKDVLILNEVSNKAEDIDSPIFSYSIKL